MADQLRVVAGNLETVVTVDGEHVTVLEETFAVRAESDGHFSAGDARGVVARSPRSVWVGIDGHVFEFVVEAETTRRKSAARGPESLMPPMSATVVRVNVSAGDHVHAGDVLVLLEAMKMELPVRATDAGVVAAVRCREGELVDADAILLEWQ